MSFDSPCNHCPAKCCRNYSVSLTRFDFIRLSSIPNLDLLSVVVFDLALNHDPLLAPSFLLNLDGSEKLYIVRLKRDKTESCIFLNKNNLCTIYEKRPQKCRTYPFVKIQNSLNLKEGARCPVSWDLSASLSKQFSLDLKDQNSQIKEFSKICSLWNNSKIEKTPDNFISFVLNFEKK